VGLQHARCKHLLTASARPATTNSSKQAHRNVNLELDGMNLTFLDGITRGRAFDDQAVQNIAIHASASLGIGTRDRCSGRTDGVPRSIDETAASRHTGLALVTLQSVPVPS